MDSLWGVLLGKYITSFQLGLDFLSPIKNGKKIKNMVSGPTYQSGAKVVGPSSKWGQGFEPWRHKCPWTSCYEDPLDILVVGFGHH